MTFLKRPSHNFLLGTFNFYQNNGHADQNYEYYDKITNYEYIFW